MSAEQDQYGWHRQANSALTFRTILSIKIGDLQIKKSLCQAFFLTLFPASQVPEISEILSF